MTLTEAQRLAFLKGREKRMANLEKKKLEDAEMAALETPAFAPEKPKVVRKPRKTKEPAKPKVPVDVKLQIDPSEADTQPETDAEEMKEQAKADPTPDVTSQPQQPLAVSQDVPSIKFDEDAIANKVVAMLLEKGVGLPPPPAPLKPKKPRVVRKTAKPKDDTDPSISGFSPKTTSFSWM